jgi:hypothetical protein
MSALELDCAMADMLRDPAARERAIDESTEAPGELRPFIRQAADAWWAFLDEREALVSTNR